MKTSSAERHLNLSGPKEQFVSAVDEVARNESRVVLEKSGTPVAAIISLREYERFLLQEEARIRRFEVFEAIGEAFADVPMDELERQIDIALAEVRADQRAGKYRDSDS